MFWNPYHRHHIWTALKTDDVEALKTVLAPALKNVKLFRQLDKGLWKDGEGKGGNPLSLAYVCTANKAGLKEEGAPKCLEFLLETYDKATFRNYLEKINAQAIALLYHRWDVIKKLQESNKWSIPLFLHMRRCPIQSFNPDNKFLVGLSLAQELGTPEDYTNETVFTAVTTEDLLPPPQSHVLFCRGGSVTLDFYAKDLRRFCVRLLHNTMYHLKKPWDGSMRIRAVTEKPTLTMYTVPQ